MDNWVSFGTNRGAVLVGEYKKVIWYYQLQQQAFTLHQSE